MVLDRKLSAKIAGGLRFLLLGASPGSEDIHKKQLRSG
jgi:hypothetical protein